MNTGFDIKADTDNMEFIYGKDVFGPITEKRKLDDIRQSLSDPNVDGPEYVLCSRNGCWERKRQRRSD